MRELLQLAPLVAVVAWAAIIDLRARRLPNWLTYPLIATGLVQAWLPGPTATPIQAWLGFAVGLARTFFLFALTTMRACDMKLLVGLGAWVVPLATVQIFAVEAVAGMLIVMARSAHAGKLASLFRGSTVIVLNAAHGDWRPPPEPQADGPKFERLPYAVPVLIGLIAVLTARAWRWL